MRCFFRSERVRPAAALALVLAAALALTALAGGCGNPEREPFEVHALSPDTLHAWMQSGHPLVLLDTRPDSLYRAERIGGAIPAAGRTIPDLREVMPLDHTAAVVFYNADGNPPVAGEDPAREAAERYGFPHVYRLEGGLRAWIARGYTVDGMRSVGTGEH